MRSYKDLIVWQKAVKLAADIYLMTEQLPRSELYGLSTQMRKCAVSIASNLAEGSRRSTRKEFRRFVCIAYGSGAELETQLEIAKQLPFGKNLRTNHIDPLLEEIMRMLNTLEKNLHSPPSARALSSPC
jgi:four helix bundle protein